MRAFNWPAFWRGYRRGVLQAYALVAVLLLAWALAGCATTKASPALTAAVTLDELGGVFIQTAGNYKTLKDGGALDEASYEEWRGFAHRFGVAWLAAKGLISAPQLGDPVAAVMALKDELFRYFLRSVSLKAEQEKRDAEAKKGTDA